MNKSAQRLRWFSSLRTRVLLLLALVFCSMFGFAFYIAYEAREDSLARALAHVTLSAEQIAAEEDDFIHSTQQFLTLIALDRDIVAFAADPRCPAILAERLVQDSRFANIAVVMPNGEFACSAMPSAVRLNVGERSYFKRALGSRAPIVGEAVVDRPSGKWSLPFVSVVRDKAGSPQAAIIASLKLDWINSRLALGHYPPDARIGIIDQQGTVVARFPDPERTLGSNKANTPFFKALRAAGGTGWAETEGFDGVRRIYAFAPFAQTSGGSLTLWLGVSTQSVMGNIDRDFAWTLAMVSAIVLLISAAVWIGGERLFLRPVSAIAEAARRLGSGDAEARTGLRHTRDELGELARVFDSMAESLKSTNRLLRANRALRVLTALNQTLVHARSEQELLDSMCSAICEAGGYCIAWVGYAEHDAEKSVRIVASWGADAEFLANLRVSWADSERGRGPSGRAIRDGRPVSAQNVRADERYAPWRAQAERCGYAASIALPLKNGTDSFGVLNLYAAEADAFDADEIGLLSEGASDLAFGITSQRAQSELARVAERVRAVSLYARSLIEASLDPLVTISPEGKITDVNRATEEVTGRERESLIGTDFADYFTEPELARSGYEQVLAEGSMQDYALTIRHCGGRLTDVLYNATIYRNERGEPQGVFAAARDVTERKRADEERRVAALYARSLIEVSLDPLVTISPKGKITDVNKATEDATGIARTALIGTDFADYFTEPVLARRVYEQVLAAGFVRDYPLTLRHRSGATMDVIYNAATYHSESGALLGVFAAARDVTKRKRAEEQVRHLNAELEQRVEERTAELEAANKELEAFAYSVSHDLRAPLRSIDGFSLALLEDYADKLDEEGKDDLQRVRAASQRMGQLIDDILNLSRVTRGPLAREAVDLSATAGEIVDELRRSDPQRRVDCAIAGGLAAEGDPRLLRLVLENLLANAWKYTSHHETARIEFGAAQTEHGRAFFVRDDGAGFDMTYADKLFVPFQRLHTPEEFSGSGIGLAIVQRIVRRHGGSVWAQGAIEAGATFFFRIG